jgi:peroxiredoxin
MLPVGSIAPEIDAETSTGVRFRLSKQDGLCTVVYFFPKAFTPGCTREATTFKENYGELRLSRAEVIGVSTDSHATQCAFANSLKVPFPMIGDNDGAIAKAYAVSWPLVSVAKRVTYVIDAARVIRGVFRHEVRIDKHRDDVLALVDQLFRERRAQDGNGGS